MAKVDDILKQTIIDPKTALENLEKAALEYARVVAAAKGKSAPPVPWRRF
jgi:hypothetical protein